MCNCPWCTGAGPPEEPDPCEYCDGDGCEDCLDAPDDGPDPETYWTARDDVAYDKGEPIRWGGLDVPN